MSAREFDSYCKKIFCRTVKFSVWFGSGFGLKKRDKMGSLNSIKKLFG